MDTITKTIYFIGERERERERGEGRKEDDQIYRHRQKNGIDETLKRESEHVNTRTTDEREREEAKTRSQ